IHRLRENRKQNELRVRRPTRNTSSDSSPDRRISAWDSAMAPPRVRKQFGTAGARLFVRYVTPVRLSESPRLFSQRHGPRALGPSTTHRALIVYLEWVWI